MTSWRDGPKVADSLCDLLHRATTRASTHKLGRPVGTWSTVHLLKPQLFSVGAFSRLLAAVPACLRGFMRIPADFAGSPSGPFLATFRSLHAILLSGLALRQRPEVRRGPVGCPFKSTGYARTVQAVGSRHCLPGGDKVVGGSNQIPPDASARLPEPGALVFPQRRRVNRQVEQGDVVGHGVIED